MIVKFWGTRGSIAKPGPSTVRYGGNTSCVEVRSSSGDIIVIDCGTGGHGLGGSLMAESAREKKKLRGHILISHTHWDHIQGIPFFVPMYVPGNRWDIYGPRGIGGSLKESLAGQMQYRYFPVELDGLMSECKYHDLVEGTFHIGPVRITARYMNHPCLTLGYRLESDGATVVYACDHEPHSRQYALGEGDMSQQDVRHVEFLRGADLVIHDSQYSRDEYRNGKVGWGHSPMECVVDMCRRAGVKRLAMSHHDPTHDDDQLERLVNDAIAASRSEYRPDDGDGVESAPGGGGPDRGWDLEAFPATEGTTFEFDYSNERAYDEEEETEGSSAESAALAAPGALHDGNLLIGIPDDDLADRIESIARADEISAPRAATTDEVLSFIESEHWPSVVILADGIVEGSALETCRAVREYESDRAKRGGGGDGDGDGDGGGEDPIPVIVIADSEPATVAGAGAGAGKDGEADDGYASGVTEYLLEPFSDQYARTRLRAWMLRTACRWNRAPPPPDEDRRQRALDGLRILDTDAEERFDRFTRMATQAFDVPIAAVSLVDRDRQWFKSINGLDATETPRDMAFCAHAILDGEVMVVPDTLRDDRFAENPLVTGDVGIRFYAGYPLRLPDGTRPGTLCVIDKRPRDITGEKIELLKELGTMVERELANGHHPRPVPGPVQCVGVVKGRMCPHWDAKSETGSDCDCDL